MGASKRRQMSSFDDDWPDQIWHAVCSKNKGDGASWKLAVAALAVTGCRPAALELGVDFRVVKEAGKVFIEARIKGVKLAENRGQPEHCFRWSTEEDTHRPAELVALTKALVASPGRAMTVTYDAEAISTRLREVSRILWPRRRYAITGYCYRELLSSTAKAAGVPPEELAAAMGHRSAESQGAYARAHRRAKTRSRAPWASVRASAPVSMKRAPMARFKAASAFKKAKTRRSI